MIKIVAINCTNFGSYSSLKYDFNDTMTLIEGKSGAGKSTIIDAITWGLFGVTGKDGNVDDVKKWGTEETVVSIALEANGEVVIIDRIRGPKNDLYFETGTSDITRGKDAKDTQKLIEKIIGCNLDSFLLNTIFNDFNPLSSFFTSTPKQKKDLMSLIIDLSFYNTLQDNTKKQQKELEKLNKQLLIDKDKLNLKMDMLEESIESYERMITDFDTNKTNRLKAVDDKIERFLSDKMATIARLENEIKQFDLSQGQKKIAVQSHINELMDLIKPDAYIKDLIKAKRAVIEADNPPCSECGQLKDIEKHLKELNAIQRRNDDCKAELERCTNMILSIDNQKSPYERELAIVAAMSDNQLKAERARIISETPDALISTHKDYSTKASACMDAIDTVFLKFQESERELNRVNKLIELLPVLRTELATSYIGKISEYTNNILTEVFDIDINIDVKIDESDDLECTIYKNGNQASFKQLSKGQRQVLKLAFLLACSNLDREQNGLKTNCLFFDESLEGLDYDLKAKAYELFVKLNISYPNIIVIDHSVELKNSFDNVITVMSENNESRMI